MKTKTLIGIVLLVGVGAAAWMYIRARSSLGTTGVPSRTVPTLSGFNYAGTPVQEPRTRPADSPVLGTAVPRSTATARTTTTTAAPQVSGAGGYAVPEFDVESPEPVFMEA